MGMLVVEDLRKSYGAVAAVDGVSMVAVASAAFGLSFLGYGLPIATARRP